MQYVIRSITSETSLHRNDGVLIHVMAGSPPGAPKIHYVIWSRSSNTYLHLMTRFSSTLRGTVLRGGLALPGSRLYGL